MAVALASFGGTVSRGFAAENLVGGSLRIEFVEARSASKGKKAKKNADLKEWKRGCKLLGDALLEGRGPWGFGLFQSTACYLGKKRLTGSGGGRSDWVLTLSTATDGTKWTLRQGSTTMAELSLPSSESPLMLLRDEEYVDLVAFDLLTRLPAGLAVGSHSVQSSKLIGRYWRAGKAADFKYDVPEAPERLVLFRLARGDGGVWHSTVVGEAKRIQLEAPKAKRVGKKSTLAGGQVVYEIDEGARRALADGPVWAQDEQGPGARSASIDQTLADAHQQLNQAIRDGRFEEFLEVGNSLFAKLLASAASGYVGARYGLQVLPAEGELGKLLNKTRVFSLLVEIRGGPVKGLRYYYDLMPKVSAGLDGPDGTTLETSIGFSRHVLGFSWGFDPGFLLNRITVDPKIGMWRFEAVMPASTNEKGEVDAVKAFELGRTFSLAMEIGGELLSDWYTLRGWGALDTGFSVVKSGGKVTSRRLGVDAYAAPGQKVPVMGVDFKIAMLAFYVFENVTLVPTKEVDPDPGEAEIQKLTYNAAYLGGGMAISW